MRIVDADYEIIQFLPITDAFRICLGYSICYGVPIPTNFKDQCEYIRKHREHESPLEHSSMSVLFTVNRGVSHQLVRHRHTAVSQESTRFCNYHNKRFGNELTFIKDIHTINNAEAYVLWLDGLQKSEDEYMARLSAGQRTDEARGCLPIDLKTKLLITTNFREWRNIFKLRCDSHAHYQMQEVMRPLFKDVCDELPCVFDDIIIE